MAERHQFVFGGDTNFGSRHLIDGKDATPPRIDAPQALILRREPKANVARYDTLRNKDLRHAS